MPLLIGTSGWQYRDWRDDNFYPPRLPAARWLEYYATVFPTVENNGTFYRLAKPETFAEWRARTPPGFLMAIKASRYLTHIRRLRDPAEPVQRLMASAVQLGDRLGPVLLQLPPNLAADHNALDKCLTEFARPAPRAAHPGGSPLRVCVEFRHESWWTDQTKELLSRHGAALCWSDRLSRPLNPLWRTADWGYLRLHEGAAQPWPRYGARALRTWADRISDTWPADADVFAYFNNDQNAAAPADAATLVGLAVKLGLPVPQHSAEPPAWPAAAMS
jgi:uncharacterized protein YecE (DUF72 family)